MIQLIDRLGKNGHITPPLYRQSIDTVGDQPLANTKQAKKRAIQAEKHRRHNASMRSLFRSSVKKVISAITKKDQDAAYAALKVATPIIDRMVGKGIVHKNKAARHKSRLVAHIRKLSDSNAAA